MKEVVFPPHPLYRPRRLRQNRNIRSLVQESSLQASDLIWPVFVCEGQGQKEPIDLMPDVFRYSIEEAIREIKAAVQFGIHFVALFPCVAKSEKSADCRNAWNPDNLVNRATRLLKKEVPEVSIMLDVALDPYNIHGHDGIVENGRVNNDLTLECLSRQALSHAQSGADVLGPSDMMDGRVGIIRETLDANGFSDVVILSYSAKYASDFYEGFRNALGSGPLLVGDKRTYQMDYRNSDEALRMVHRDLKEGADMVMIKPGLPYLDICRRVADSFNVPVLAYQVSGEYAMIQGALRSGLFSSDAVIFETLHAFKRAGCSGVLTYFAPYVARTLRH